MAVHARESALPDSDRQKQFQNLLIELSAAFINLPFAELSAATQDALRDMAIFTSADRAYIFEYDFARDVARNTYEYCPEGIDPAIDFLQAVPNASMAEWVSAHKRGDTVYIPLVDALPPGDQHDLLKAQGIKSVLAIPLMDSDFCIGFVGFDAVRQPRHYGAEDIRLLTVFGGLIVSIRKRMEAQERLQLASNVFEHTREGIMVTDAAGNIVEVNAAFENITGYSRPEVLGKNPRMLSSGLHDSQFYRDMWQKISDTGFWSGEIWNRRKSGELYPQLLTISLVGRQMESGHQYVAMFSDITVQKDHQKQLEHLAHHDALTGLPNRVSLAKRLQVGMQRVREEGGLLAVAYIDIDGFKYVNDTYGHPVGDALLKALTARMKSVMRSTDMLARIGGDEFVAVLSHLARSEAVLPSVERLLNSIARPIDTEGHVLKVSGSIGVAFFPQDEDVDADQLLRQADQAMYLSKVSGKNRYTVFDDSQDRRIKSQFASLTRFRHAIENDELVLHYQPKVNLRSGEIIGAEALVRWQDPARGLVPPAEFLPLIENHPLAIALGEWVINDVLRQLSRWKSEGWWRPVSINIGALQLQQPDFIHKLKDLLSRYPTVRPEDIELEVLETTGLEDYGQVNALMDACRKIGVRFALDDFGSGYSSLTYLKRLPANKIKIDQSFVRDMLEAPEDIAILEGVVGLAASLGRKVIAEGMETIEHGEILLLLGCELAQGYGIARPMPAGQLRDWALGWKPHPAWRSIPPLSREKLPVLFAMVEFRAWIGAMHRFMEGKIPHAPHWAIDLVAFESVLSRLEGQPLRSNLSIRRLIVSTAAWVSRLPETPNASDMATREIVEVLSDHYDAWIVPLRQILGLSGHDLPVRGFAVDTA